MSAATAPAQPGRRSWRTAGVALGLLTALGLVIAVTSSWWDLVLGNYWPILQALTPLWLLLTALGFIVAGVVAWRLRQPAHRTYRMIAAATAVALGLAGGATAWLTLRTPAAASAAQVPEHPTRSLTMMSSNLEYGRANPQQVVAAVRAHHVDVLVLVELTTDELKRLDAAGLKTALPHRTSPLVNSGSIGSMVLSRHPVTTVSPGFPPNSHSLQMPVADVRMPGGRVHVKAVHTYPPLRDGQAHWRPQLRQLGAWQRADASSHLILAGDFNASRAHPAFRAASDGLLDALATTSSPGEPTWPHGGRIPAFTQIDHILTRGFAATESGVIVLEGTDHAAVYSRLRY